MSLPQGNFQQSASAGGTPTAFFNYITPAPFEPLIYEHWDEFETFWKETLGRLTPLYAVEIVFNNEIYLSGRGAIPAEMSGVLPERDNFVGDKWFEIKKKIGRIADRLAIPPVQKGTINPTMPNLVFVVNPRFPKPGQNGNRGREAWGTSSSNL